MPSPRIVLSLALLPALLVAPACDEKQGPGPNTGDVADDSDTGGETPDTTGDIPDGPPEPDATDTDDSDTADVPDGTDSEGDSEGDDEPQPPPPQPDPRPEQAQPCPGLEWPYSQACTTEGGQEGTSVCVLHEGEEVWTACSTEEVECLPGDGLDQGCLGDICAFDGAELYRYSWSEPDCNTPLVLNFDGAPLRFDAAAAASFDISGVGQCLSTDWPTLPWLALDRDGDGAIESGRELFGSGTVLRSGARASHGFEALAEHDLNRDGKIDAADPVFAELVLWSDGDGDRRGELGELVPVSHVELVAIHLDVAVRAECDDRGNCGRERARFEWRGLGGETRSGEVVDVYLACQ